MAIHLHGWAEDIDPAGAFANIAALADNLGLNDGDDLIVPTQNKVALIAAGISSLGNQRVRIDAPSIRRIGRFEVQPLNGGADADAEPLNPPAILDLRRNPLQLVTNERVICEVDSNPTVAQLHWCLLWLVDAVPEPITSPQVSHVRITTTVTLTVNVWSNTTLTFADALPVGRYRVIGGRFQDDNLVAWRLSFRDFTNRPGALAVDDENDQDSELFHNGELGSWGEFESTAAPTIDFLAGVADANPVGVLDIVQVREGPS